MIDRPAFAEKIGDAFIAGDVGRDVCRTDLVGSSLQTLSIARGDHNVCALLPDKLRGRKTDAGRTSDDNNFLSGKRHRVVSPVWTRVSSDN